MAQLVPLTDEQQAAPVGKLVPILDTTPEGRRPAGVASFMSDAQRRKDEDRARRFQRLDEITGYQMAPGGMDDIPLRWDLARSNEWSEKLAKFRERYPEGDMVAVPFGDGQTVTVFKRTKNDPWREVNPPGMDVGTVGDVLGGTVNEATVGGFAGGVMFGLPGAAAGTLLGGVAKSGVENLRGFEDTPAWEMFKQSGIEAAVSTATAMGVGSGIVAYRLSRGIAPGLSTDAGKVAAAATILDLPPAVVGQMARNPVLRGLFFQTGATSPKPAAVISEQERGLLDAFRAEAEKSSLDGLTDEALDTIAALQQRELGRLYQFAAYGLPNAGDALRTGVQTWEKLSQEVVNRAYTAARQASGDTVYFDLSPVAALAEKIRRGTTVKAQPLPPGVAGPIPALRAEGAVSGELKAVLDDLEAIDPSVRWLPDGTGAFDQVKAIRSRLSGLMFSEDSTVAGAAKQLYGALSEVMKQPLGTNSKEFLASYLRANALNAQREGIEELNLIVRAVNEKTLSDDIAGRFFRPGNAEKLYLLKQLMPQEQFVVLQEGFKGDLFATGATSGGNAIIKRLDAFAKDPDSLRLLMSPQDERAIRNYATALAKFDEGGVRSVMNRDFSLAERALKLGQSKVEDLRRTVGLAGGPDSSFAEGIRAGIYKRLLDDATEFDAQNRVPRLNPEKLVQGITAAQKNEAYSVVMRPEDWGRLENYQIYSAAISGTGDVGGAMQAGSVRAGALNPTAPAKFIGAWRTIANNAVIARLLSKPVLADRIPASPRLDVGKINLATVTLATLAQEMARGVSQPSIRPE